MKPPKDRRRGSAMVESSLVLLVFFMMLVAIFDFGQVLFMHNSITERVREALRWGIVNTYDATAIQNYVLYGQSTAPAGATGFFSMTPSNVSVQRADAGTSDDRIVITVSDYSFMFLSPYLSSTKSGAPITEALSYEGQ